MRPYKGWIYVMTNPAMPDVIKIGKTSNDPDFRARQLRETGVPLPFEVRYSGWVSDYESVEKEIFEILSDYRISDDREFFSCDVATAVEEIRNFDPEHETVNYYEDGDDVEDEMEDEELEDKITADQKLLINKEAKGGEAEERIQNKVNDSNLTRVEDSPSQTVPWVRISPPPRRGKGSPEEFRALVEWEHEFQIKLNKKRSSFTTKKIVASTVLYVSALLLIPALLYVFSSIILGRFYDFGEVANFWIAVLFLPAGYLFVMRFIDIFHRVIDGYELISKYMNGRADEIPFRERYGNKSKYKNYI